MFVTAPGWAEILREAELDSFDRLWNLERNWIEAPNERRQGWSGVVRRDLASGGESATLFIKRQQGQNRRTLRHPFRGRPTYYLEYCFLERLRTRFPQLVGYACYGQQRHGRLDRAVLATVGLVHYRDLNTLAGELGRAELKAVLAEVHRAVLPLHRAGLQHGALYAGHVFVHNDTRTVKLIDLERARFRARKRAAAIADLRQFVHRTDWLDEDLFATLIAPWEEPFPGIRAQLPPTREERG